MWIRRVHSRMCFYCFYQRKKNKNTSIQVLYLKIKNYLHLIDQFNLTNCDKLLFTLIHVNVNFWHHFTQLLKYQRLWYSYRDSSQSYFCLSRDISLGSTESSQTIQLLTLQKQNSTACQFEMHLFYIKLLYLNLLSISWIPEHRTLAPNQ